MPVLGADEEHENVVEAYEEIEADEDHRPGLGVRRLDLLVIVDIEGRRLVEARGQESGIGDYPDGRHVPALEEEPAVDWEVDVAHAAMGRDAPVEIQVHLGLHELSVQVDLPVIPDAREVHPRYPRRAGEGAAARPGAEEHGHGGRDLEGDQVGKLHRGEGSQRKRRTLRQAREVELRRPHGAAARSGRRDDLPPGRAGSWNRR